MHKENELFDWAWIDARRNAQRVVNEVLKVFSPLCSEPANFLGRMQWRGSEYRPILRKIVLSGPRTSAFSRSEGDCPASSILSGREF